MTLLFHVCLWKTACLKHKGSGIEISYAYFQLLASEVHIFVVHFFSKGSKI